MTNDEEIGARLKIAREAKGFKTARDAAASLGIPYPTYVQHESGRRGIVREAPLYARRLKISLDWLMRGIGPGPDGASSDEPEAGDIPQFNIHAGMGGGGALSVIVDEDGAAVDPADVDGFWSFPDSVKAGW